MRLIRISEALFYVLMSFTELPKAGLRNMLK